MKVLYARTDGLKPCGVLGWAASIIRTGAQALRRPALPAEGSADDTVAREAARDLVTTPGQGEGR